MRVFIAEKNTFPVFFGKAEKQPQIFASQ